MDDRVRTSAISGAITVGDLVRYLSTLPASMPIVTTRFSDYQAMTLDDFNVLEAVPGHDYWMRVYGSQKPRMDSDVLKRAVPVLFVDGN